MGFSLVGNSGSSSNTTNVQNYTADINPQFEQSGSGAGSLAVDLAPTLQGSDIGTYAPDLTDYYAPIDIVSTGDLYGDSALQALSAVSGQVTAANQPTASTTASTGLSSLLSGDTIYYVLGAIVLLWLAHGKG